MTLDAEMIVDHGECWIDTRDIAAIPTKAGQSLQASVQAFIFEQLRNHGLPIATSTQEGIIAYTEREFWILIRSALKAIGCTVINGACHPHEHHIVFRWR